jgi:hypothetical protein
MFKIALVIGFLMAAFPSQTNFYYDHAGKRKATEFDIMKKRHKELQETKKRMMENRHKLLNIENCS